jgi:hypothetical protein
MRSINATTSSGCPLVISLTWGMFPNSFAKAATKTTRAKKEEKTIRRVFMLVALLARSWGSAPEDCRIADLKVTVVRSMAAVGHTG